MLRHISAPPAYSEKGGVRMGSLSTVTHEAPKWQHETEPPQSLPWNVSHGEMSLMCVQRVRGQWLSLPGSLLNLVSIFWNR